MRPRQGTASVGTLSYAAAILVGGRLKNSLCAVATGSEGVADVVYIPIYDRLASKDAGVQGVLEVMVHRNATEPMVVASAITFVGALLGQLQVGVNVSLHLCRIKLCMLACSRQCLMQRWSRHGCTSCLLKGAYLLGADRELGCADEFEQATPAASAFTWEQPARRTGSMCATPAAA